MKVEGLVLVGSRCTERAAMATFVRDLLQLTRSTIEGVDADVFVLPDRSSFVVTDAADGHDERTIGFLVADLDTAAAELRAAEVEVDEEISVNDQFRYVHFRAPDNRLYELVERRPTRQ
jgi:hypothetical protein